MEVGELFGEEDIVDDNHYRTFSVACSSEGGGELLVINKIKFNEFLMKK